MIWSYIDSVVGADLGRGFWLQMPPWSLSCGAIYEEYG